VTVADSSRFLLLLFCCVQLVSTVTVADSGRFLLLLFCCVQLYQQ